MRFVSPLGRSAACLILMTALTPSLLAEDLQKEALKPQEVLDRMAKVYSSCKTYRDSGLVKIDIPGCLPYTAERPFKTAFIRPSRFRFEFTEKKLGVETRFVVWQSGREVRTWWDVTPGIEKVESLGLALAGATGVSGGAAHTVPALLLPIEVGAGSRTLIETTELSRLADAKLGKVDCFCIKGKSADDLITLWIDKKTFLLRRIDEPHKTTTYDPAIDEKVPENSLNFNPQKK